MKTGLVNFRIAPAMDNGSVIVRRARTAWECAGGHDGKQHTKCTRGPIWANTVYVEYTGETSPYGSGVRYHVECAAEQGLVERIGPLTYKITRRYDDQETVVATGIQSLREAEEVRTRYINEAAMNAALETMPDFHIGTEGR